MTKQIIESILTPIRALIMRSRPAYKDYLGEETVEEKRVLVSGAFNDSIKSSVTFTEGETYLVNLDGTESEMTAQDISLILIIGGS